MAITAERQLDTLPAQINQGGQKSDSIRYRVVGEVYSIIKAKVLADEGITGLPSVPKLDEHPDYPVMRARQATVSRVPESGGEVAYVDIFFSTSNFPGAGLLYGSVDVFGGQFVLGSLSRRVEVSIPVATLEEHVASVGGEEQSLIAWRVHEKKIRESRTVLRARWGIQGRQLDVAEMAIFGEEAGKIHTIGNKEYLFLEGVVTARDNLVYEVNASWEQDEGTPAKFSTDPSVYLLPNDMPYMQGEEPPDGLMRKPYHYLDTLPAKDVSLPPINPDSNPRLSQVPIGPPGDHTRLPGVPNL